VRGVSPLTIPMVMPSSVAAHLSLRFGFGGPCVTVSAACASGAAAIGEGVELLRRGAADVVLAGGVDALVNYGAMCCFMRLDAMSRHVSCPGLASRPFDADRDGFVMGEGAGFVVLQRLEDVAASGPEPLGLVLGHASTADAYHLVAPSPDGAGAVRCMELALADAGIGPGDVAHVNAHGTSTVLNDRAEAVALTALFAGSCPPVMAVKGSTGHMIAGSGAVEAIVSLISCGIGWSPRWPGSGPSTRASTSTSSRARHARRRWAMRYPTRLASAARTPRSSWPPGARPADPGIRPAAWSHSSG
jgi:3-oxoacyl-[acyl-carrier-protein] synthase II